MEDEKKQENVMTKSRVNKTNEKVSPKEPKMYKQKQIIPKEEHKEDKIEYKETQFFETNQNLRNLTTENRFEETKGLEETKEMYETRDGIFGNHYYSESSHDFGENINNPEEVKHSAKKVSKKEEKKDQKKTKKNDTKKKKRIEENKKNNGIEEDKKKKGKTTRKNKERK